MAVPAIELRPRGALALFDAAIRLCARSSGVWAITLPAGALVTGALLGWLDAILHVRPLLWPSALLTLAWLGRALAQGAACRHLEAELLANDPPSVRQSLLAAGKRAPSLFITAAYNLVFNLVTLPLTLGLSVLFLSAHVVGYAVAMQGKGHPLALYGTASKLLGQARSHAPWIRIFFSVQALVFLNLHITSVFVIYLGRKVVGMDLAYAQRFASLDNAAWLGTLLAVAFALFEPLRAAVSTLLLIDGRVRQEGLDLLAVLEQLPRRRATAGATPAAALVLVLAAGALAPSPARAAELTEKGALRARYWAVGNECGVSGEAFRARLDAVEALAATNRTALSRTLERAERLAYQEGDCDAAAAGLERDLAWAEKTRSAAEQLDGESAAQRAKEILSRPEFLPDGEMAPEAEAPKAESSGPTWWDRFLQWLRDALFRRDPDRARASTSTPVGGGELLANALVVVLIALLIAALGWILFSVRGRGAAAEERAQLSSSPLVEPGHDPNSALARPPEGWARLADELARDGRFREAVRSLYLALLSRLHREGAIDYDPARSNWEYFRGFKGQAEWLSPFKELTRRFDHAWYGNEPVSADGYRAFRQLTEPMLATPRGGAAHA